MTTHDTRSYANTNGVSTTGNLFNVANLIGNVPEDAAPYRPYLSGKKNRVKLVSPAARARRKALQNRQRAARKITRNR